PPPRARPPTPGPPPPPARTPPPAVPIPAAGPLKGCEDFQAQIPAFLAGTLPPARALLVEDHTRSCIACRRALKEARSGEKAVAAPVQPASRISPRFRRGAFMSLAAVLLFGLGLGLVYLFQQLP